jgi:hypothetical protein
MKKEINHLQKSYKMFPILLGIGMIFSVLLSGCSKGPPACDSEKVKKAVIDQRIADLKSQVSSIAASGPGMELTEDEWRMMRAGMNFELRNIKQFSFDEASGTLECEADLVTFSSGMKSSMPIEYTAEVIQGTDLVRATIYELE